MFSRVGLAAYKKDLFNILALEEYLDNPHQKFKSIHVAGTNGKGSVSHMLAAILQTAGYKTGLYTSPHLKDFRERIKVNGEMISEKFVTSFTQKIMPAIDKVNPSFFEITVAMAFEYFAEMQVDIAVIEVGLGGRLDSTNIIMPELSVITNIGWDHMNILGDSLDKIAREKAGIIKPGIPVVVGEVLPETENVFENISGEKNASLHIASRNRAIDGWYWEKYTLEVDVAEQHKTGLKHYYLDLPGIYQSKNLLTVLETCSLLQQRGWKINDTIIQTALGKVRKLTGLHGRWEIMQFHPMVVLDVAHNADGMKQIVQQIELTDHNELFIILGMVKDKETEKILSVLPPSARYYFTQAHIPRSLKSEILREKALAFHLKGEIYPDVNTALKHALDHAGKEDMILVCGSVFLVGEVK